MMPKPTMIRKGKAKFQPNEARSRKNSAFLATKIAHMR